MGISIREFKAALKHNGARPNLYQVIGKFPSSTLNGSASDFKFLCKAAQIPQGTINPIPVQFSGRSIKIPGDRAYDPWSLTIINDEDYKYRNAFENWQKKINDPAENIRKGDATTFNGGLLNEWKVYQLSRTGAVLQGYKVVGAWPTVISAIELGWDTTDSIEEFSVTLEFQYWEPLDKSNLSVSFDITTV